MYELKYLPRGAIESSACKSVLKSSFKNFKPKVLLRTWKIKVCLWKKWKTEKRQLTWMLPRPYNSEPPAIHEWSVDFGEEKIGHSLFYCWCPDLSWDLWQITAGKSVRANRALSRNNDENLHIKEDYGRIPKFWRYKK